MGVTINIFIPPKFGFRVFRWQERDPCGSIRASGVGAYLWPVGISAGFTYPTGEDEEYELE